MEIIVFGIGAVVALLIVARMIGRGQEKVLGEYEVLEKRFGLKQRTHRSRWGKGINERYSLEGAFRGYPVSLYSHFKKVDTSKTEWTSLVMEVLFAEELVVDIEFSGTAEKARFASEAIEFEVAVCEGVRFRANVNDGNELLTDSLKAKLETFSQKAYCGAFRLSKGFLEYRETGLMTKEAMRTRYQEALLALADLADAISVFVVESKRN